jgi:hypothetical protein
VTAALRDLVIITVVAVCSGWGGYFWRELLDARERGWL